LQSGRILSFVDFQSQNLTQNNWRNGNVSLVIKEHDANQLKDDDKYKDIKLYAEIVSLKFNQVIQSQSFWIKFYSISKETFSKFYGQNTYLGLIDSPQSLKDGTYSSLSLSRS